MAVMIAVLRQIVAEQLAVVYDKILICAQDR
jgi:hypothetical protein